MKIVLTLLLSYILLLTSGCVTTNYDIDYKSDLSMSEFSVIYGLSKGYPSGDTFEFLFKEVDGNSLQGKSKRWLNISPGTHTVSVQIKKENVVALYASGITSGLAGGTQAVAMNIGMHSAEMGSFYFEGDEIEMEFKAGKIYVFEPHIDDDEKVMFIEVTEY